MGQLSRCQAPLKALLADIQVPLPLLLLLSSRWCLDGHGLLDYSNDTDMTVILSHIYDAIIFDRR